MGTVSPWWREQIVANEASTMSPSVTPIPRAQSRTMATRLHDSLRAFAGRITSFLPFGVRSHESVMQFAERGRLFCACMPLKKHRPRADRRQVCRGCGLDVRALSRNVDRNLTEKEIRGITRNLRLAGIRTSGLEIPASVTTLRQLNVYLAGRSLKPSGSNESKDLPAMEMVSVAGSSAD